MTASMGRAFNTHGSTRLDRLIVAALVLCDLTGIVVDGARRTISTAPAVAGLGVVSLATAASFLWRRQRPLLVMVASIGGVIVGNSIHHPALVTQRTGAQFVLAVFGVASWGTHRRFDAIVPGVIAAIAALGTAMSGKGVVATLSIPLALVAAPWFAGYASRMRRQHLADVEQRLVRAEADRESRARRAVADERAKLARELHDVVAHHVSLIGVQAGAARVNLGSDNDRTRQALAHIETSSRAAVAEMRYLLDALTSEPGSATTAPPPTLAEFDTLCDGYRGAGLDVRRTVTGDIGTVPQIQAVALYRMVEEALTNVTRHSTASTCSVRLNVGDQATTLVVDDPGWRRPNTLTTEPGSGHGLTGIRQRVELLGGCSAIGPTSTGGFVVEAVIPLRSV